MATARRGHGLLQGRRLLGGVNFSHAGLPCWLLGPSLGQGCWVLSGNTGPWGVHTCWTEGCPSESHMCTRGVCRSTPAPA